MNQPRRRLHEAATVASVLNDIMNIGRNGDDNIRAKVLTQLHHLKRTADHVPEIAALQPSPEMFGPSKTPAQPVPPQQQAAATKTPAQPVPPQQAAATGNPAEAGGNVPPDANQPGLFGGPQQEQPAASPTAPVNNTAPQANAAAPVAQQPPPPTPAPVYNAANPQRLSAADYQAALAKAGGNPAKVNGTVVDQVVPPGQAAPAAAAPVAPNGAAPSPPAQSSFAAASPPPQAPSPAPTSGPNGVPFMITNAMKVNLRARGLTDDQISRLTPAQAHEQLTAAAPSTTTQAQPAAPAAPVTPAAAAPWNQNVLARRVYQQVAAEIGKPQPDQQQVGRLISDAISQTQIGTPERQSVVDMIKSLQGNSALRGKMPGLAAIKTETRRTLGKLLREASDPNLLSASELDKICIKVANTLVQTHSVEMPSSDKADPGNDGNTQKTSNMLQSVAKSAITLQAFTDVVKFTLKTSQLPSEVQNQLTAIEGILKNSPHIAVQNLLVKIDQDRNIRVKSANLAKEVVAVILKAVKRSG